MALSKQADGRCEYCKCPESFSPQVFSIEHIIPHSKGGSHDIENLAFSCQGCNAFKSIKIEAIDPVTGMPAAIFQPRSQLWSKHFAWDESSMFIIGLTSTGRATVLLLRLNSDYVVNLRKVLVLAGEHPPT